MLVIDLTTSSVDLMSLELKERDLIVVAIEAVIRNQLVLNPQSDFAPKQSHLSFGSLELEPRVQRSPCAGA